MKSVTLPQAIRIVEALNPDDRQALYDYLHDTLPANGRRIVQVSGTLGTPMAEEEGDPIAHLLAEVRHERNAQFDEAWSS